MPTPAAPYALGLDVARRKQNDPTGVASAEPGLTETEHGAFDMADAFPKQILPHLEGKIGELRKMRFWSKVDIRTPEECWEWQASLHTSGYGRFKIASYTTVMANRFALVIQTGEDRIERLALHHCDNPRCCNPHHLYWGTHTDNMRDKVRRGRHVSGDQSGANNGAAKLTDEQFALVIARLKDGWNNKQIAADLPVTHSMVSLIRLGRMWAPQSAALGWEPKAQFIRRKSA